ncbi:unknown [Clostridium sp. CAG:269]|nr:unknown [Clostridium sp. CAG:269]
MKKEIIKIIVVAFVLTIILSTISLGKYFNKTKINVNSGVAIPIIKLEGEQKLIINNNQENKVYNLAVKNYDENEQITQVELEYYIEIISKKNDNINFKIYKEEKELNINNNKTEKFLLTKENKQRDNYKIEILLNKKISEDILQNVEIKVYSEQKNKKEVKE